MASRKIQFLGFLFLGGISIGSIFIADVLGTKGVKMIAARREKETAKLNAFRTQSEAYHHGLLPGVENAHTQWGPFYYRVATNSLTFRDSDARVVPLKMPANLKRRVVLIGDSFTEGIGIEFEKTFAGILKEKLAPQGIEVLNAGVVSYAPMIYLSKTRHLLEKMKLEFQELVVLLDISDIHDEVKYEKQRLEILEKNRKPSDEAKPPRMERISVWMEDHTTLTKYAFRHWKKPEPPRKSVDEANRYQARWTIEPAIYKEYAVEGLRLAHEHLDALKKLCDRHHVTLNLVIYPWPYHLEWNDLNSKQATIWAAWAKARNVRFLNLFPEFLQNHPGEDLRNTAFIPDDVHWNEKGHQIVADQLLKFLESQSNSVFSTQRK